MFRFQKKLIAVAKQRGGAKRDLRSSITQIFREIDTDSTYTLTEDEMIVFCNVMLNLNMSLTHVQRYSDIMTKTVVGQYHTRS